MGEMMDGAKKGSLRAAGLEQGLDPERFERQH